MEQRIENDTFTEDQKWEIEQGEKLGLDVSLYAKPEFLAIQMREIRVGMLDHLPVSWYAKPEYDWFQMEEVRKGLQAGIIVQSYADPDIPFEVMRQLRKGLEEGIDMSDLKDKPAGTIREVRKARRDGIDILPYVKAGYDAEQLKEIRHAKMDRLDIDPYLSLEFRGISLQEIRLGLERRVDVSCYANLEYNWQQMKEIRLGLEESLDVEIYWNSLYSWQQMKEIRLGLEAGLDVSYYSSMMYTAKAMHERRMHLLEPEPAASEEETEQQTYTQFKLEVEEGAMQARIYLQDKETPIPENILLDALKEHEVVRGIDYAVLKEVCEGTSKEDVRVIAKGSRPQPGKDGWYEFFFDRDFKATPLCLEDGSVDYQNAKWFEMVKKDQTLVEYHPAEEGARGYTIHGDMLPSKKGLEKKVLSGTGFDVSGKQSIYKASYDGKVEYKDGLLTVTAVLLLEDVTMTTGNVTFDGSIYVRGMVGDGVNLTATGDILVDGFIGAANLKAGGDIILRQGNNAAGHGYLQATHNVRGRFFEAVSIKAGDDIYANYCMNSSLEAGGRIKISGQNGVLVGGEAVASDAIEARSIGNDAGVPTSLKLGKSEDLSAKEMVIADKCIKAKDELKLLKNALADFRSKYPPEQRNNNAVYLKLEEAVDAKEGQLDRMRKQRRDLEKRQKKTDMARVVVSGMLYEGVKVSINGASIKVRDRARAVTLHKQGDRVRVYKTAR